jgi:hypothetical protein
MLTAVVMMMMMIIIIIIKDFERSNTSNLKVLHRISSILFHPPTILTTHFPYIYHNIILPFFTGFPDNIFPKVFLAEILYAFCIPVY